MQKTSKFVASWAAAMYKKTGNVYGIQILSKKVELGTGVFFVFLGGSLNPET